MQDGCLSDVGGRALAEGLKGNSSVTWVDVVSRGGLFVVVVSLTCVEQNRKFSHDVLREIAQGLLARHGVEQGIIIGHSFFDFETREKILIQDKIVRCMPFVYDACRVCTALRTCRRPLPLPPRTSFTLIIYCRFTIRIKEYTSLNSWRTTVFCRCAQT